MPVANHTTLLLSGRLSTERTRSRCVKESKSDPHRLRRHCHGEVSSPDARTQRDTGQVQYTCLDANDEERTAIGLTVEFDHGNGVLCVRRLAIARLPASLPLPATGRVPAHEANNKTAAVASWAKQRTSNIGLTSRSRRLEVVIWLHRDLCKSLYQTAMQKSEAELV